MQATHDHELLRRYAAEKSDDAFGALVSRYVKLVYSAALRQVRDPHAAQDVTQSVFVLLARKAKSLPGNIVLSGWLYRATGYVASDAIRADTRRRKRDEIAMESFSEAIASSPWDEIQPILDEAMHDLGKQEREFVLLRYFENRSLREIGDVMGVSEDAAQKRVSRALERLRDLLARRGAKVTATALAAALLSYSSAAAPASAISMTSLATSAVGVTAFSKLAIDFMAITKLKAAAVVVAFAAVASAPIITQQRTINELRADNQRLTAGIEQIKAQPPAPAQAQITEAEAQQLRNEAAEIHRLRAQVAVLSKTQPQLTARANTVSPNSGADLDEATAKDPMKRHQLGQKLAAEGKLAEALEQYLWCYDEGAKASPSFVGVRSSFLLNSIKDLGARYPAAREALVSRRDTLEAAITSSQTGDTMKALELVRLNESLDEPNKSMSLFDQLPEGHPARGKLVEMASEQFIRANRYQDIVQASNPEAAFDTALLSASATKRAGINDPNLEAFTRRNIIQTGGRNIQALAGAGEVTRAIALTDKVLNFDSSPETKGELLKYAERAGNPTVVQHLRGQ